MQWAAALGPPRSLGVWGSGRGSGRNTRPGVRRPGAARGGDTPPRRRAYAPPPTAPGSGVLAGHTGTSDSDPASPSRSLCRASAVCGEHARAQRGAWREGGSCLRDGGGSAVARPRPRPATASPRGTRSGPPRPFNSLGRWTWKVMSTSLPHAPEQAPPCCLSFCDALGSIWGTKSRMVYKRGP